MPKFTLIAEHTDLYGKPNGTKVNYDFQCDYLPEVLEHVDLFLRGCGFYSTGILDYVDEFAETNMDFGMEQDWDTPQDDLQGYGHIKDEDVSHSNFYFDTERNK